LKGKLLGKAKWYTSREYEGKISSPHSVEAFGDQNPPKMGRCDLKFIIMLFFIHIDAFRVEKMEELVLRTIFTSDT